jgi:hypothetical protein
LFSQNKNIDGLETLIGDIGKVECLNALLSVQMCLIGFCQIKKQTERTAGPGGVY